MKRSKHIQTRFQFIRESSESGEFRPDFISTGNQLRDILTKALPRARFQELRAKIGMVLVGKFRRRIVRNKTCARVSFFFVI
jgi:hypothetical protein